MHLEYTIAMLTCGDPFASRLVDDTTVAGRVVRLVHHLNAHGVDGVAKLKTLLSFDAAIMRKLDKLEELLTSRTSKDSLMTELARFCGKRKRSAVAAL